MYKALLTRLAERDCHTFAEFVEHHPPAGIVLRHDVDKRPGQSLLFARLQQEMGIRGTYYFRSVRESFEPGIIKAIGGMGHEIGYHYEDLALVERAMKREKGKGSSENGDRRPETGDRETETGDRETETGDRETETGKRKTETGDRRPEAGKEKILNIEHRMSNDKEVFERAIAGFAWNLARMREVADIRTICMHGSPLSRWDSRMLWERYDYRDYGIIGEPYFDVDFNTVAYYTDTGRPVSYTHLTLPTN